MNLTPVWNRSGFPEETAIYEAVLICPNGITGPNNPPWPAAKFSCSIAAKPDPFWPIGIELYVLVVADGQTQTQIDVYKTLAEAQAAGSGSIATYSSPVWQFLSPQAEDATLVRVGSSEPDLGGYHLGARPRTDGVNPLWSVYKTPAASSSAVELALCDSIVSALEARTGSGDALEDVEVISCGPPPDVETLPAGQDSVRVTIGAARRSEDVAEIGRRHLLVDVTITVTCLGLRESGLVYRRVRGLLGACQSILTDENRSFAFRLMTSSFGPPAQVGGDLLAYQGTLELEADLLTADGG